MENSHPVEVEVGHPHEIDEIFDAISYSKGSVIIRMLYEYLGKEAFSQGINSYLKKFEYSNAFTEDLWESLATASGKPVKEIMDTWTKQVLLFSNKSFKLFIFSENIKDWLPSFECC